MNREIEHLRSYFEKFGFEVCERLGDYLGIQAARIRLFFIYAAFLTMGSPVILYMILLFIKEIRYYIRKRKTSVFDL
ncbi:MAG: PspC domain-containing protein [Thermaurantimonas sp.]|uniref:PspC domain-containing protein n=1 Tax=Thermaurantimonas sp. TaxID=2681568 RepID=UPI00391A9216